MIGISERVQGFTESVIREMTRVVSQLGGVTVAATKKLIETGVIPRDESVVISITGNGLKTPDALYDRLDAHVKIKPSLSAFDRALADLKNQTS